MKEASFAPCKMLKDISKLGSGTTPSRKNQDYYGGDIPWVKSGELRENTITRSEEYVTPKALDETSLSLIPAGALLVAMYGATVGRLGVLGIAATTNQAICHVVPNSDLLELRYLYHWLSSQVSKLLALRVGGAQPNISQAILKELRIPVPPLEEQRRIAAILDQADALRDKRRQALALVEQLTQSIFIEMFGSGCWPTHPIGSLILPIESGKSPVCKARPAKPGEWSVLKLGAISKGYFDSKENKALSNATEPDSSLEALPGDLLFARKNTYDLVGATAIVRSTPGLQLLPDLIFRITPRERGGLLREYLHVLFRQSKIRSSLKSIASGSSGSMPNISKARLQNLEIPLPPLELQQEFARRVEAVEKLKAAHQRSLEEMDALFAYLQHRAFQGEL